MVNKTKDIIFKLLGNSAYISPEDSTVIQKIINEYPYFQQVYLLQTHFLKNHHSYYKNSLQKTSARTIDRSRLYELIEVQKKNKNRISSRQKKENQPVETPSEGKKKEKKLKTIAESSDNKGKKKSYLEWILEIKKPNSQSDTKIFDAIESFLRDRPKIVPKRENHTKPPAIIEKSIEEKQMLMTETLANLYVKQKKYDKAIQAFKILSLKYPKKSSYFANRIKELKKLK